ncbi:MAG TPA: hypothetical protein VEU07_08815, partial [Candidatus Acidoferrum sp.]|nr:hypothetical protein [Candidatus Acidoferrum sp.]
IPDAEEFVPGGLATGEDNAGFGETQKLRQETTASRVSRPLYRWRTQAEREAFGRLYQELVARGAGVYPDCQEHVRTVLYDGRTIDPHA